MSRPPVRILLLLLAGLVLAGILWSSSPGHSSWMPRCPTYTYLSLYCPGCGNTRAAHALLHGDLLLSLRNNLLLLPMGAMLVLLFLKPAWAYNRRLTGFLLIVLILFTVLRNLPFYPCTLLAPVPAS